MILTYGGVSIQILKTHLIHAENVYDPTGLDYLWTKYTIDISGIINPQATSYVTIPDNPNPVALPGNAAALTIANIRDTLSLPRQVLTLADEAGNLLIQSPASAPVQALPAPPAFKPGGGIVNNIVQPPIPLDCDCDGQGPKPLKPPEVFFVQGIGKTIGVRFAISTTINDSIFWVGQGGIHTPKTPLGGGQFQPLPPVILSNRWSIEETLDEGAFSTRTYKGHAIFRADLLRDILAPFVPVDAPPIPNTNRLAIPDDFRSYWAGFYCPKGFQRRQIWVQEDPSGFAVDYQVTDLQLPVSILTSERRAYKIEAVRRTFVSRPRTDEDIRYWGQEGPSIAGNFAAAAGAVFSASTYLNPGEAISRQFALGISLMASTLPRVNDEIVITAYGQPGSNRTDLAKLCYKVLVNAGELSEVAGFGAHGVIADLQQDLMGKWVRLTVVRRLGPVNSLFQVGGNPNHMVANLLPVVQADDGIPGVTSSTPGIQPVFPGDSNTRGTALEALVAQALMYPYNEAPAPPGDQATMQGQVPP